MASEKQLKRRAENQAYLENEFIQKTLNMLSHSEGTNGDYKKMVYGLVTSSPLYPSLKDKKNVQIPSLSRFPQILVEVNKKKGFYSTAAGKYQILKKTYNGCAAAMGLTDFSENTQDLCAVELIRGRKGALGYILMGDITSALTKTDLPKEWASLAGAGYGQHENKLEKLVGWFNSGAAWVSNNPGAAGASSGLLILGAVGLFF